MKKIMSVFGTRPEAIKMAPILKEIDNRNFFQSVIVLTGQHKEMVDYILDEFELEANFNLEIMSDNQTLTNITTRVLEKLSPVIKSENPDLILVHGDTSTSFAAALAAFYHSVPVGHVEAGLRSGSIQSPFPEEFNRKGISLIANLHFAPTINAKNNLLLEGIVEEKIFITGNSIVDAIKFTVKKDFQHPLIDWSQDKRLIILTTHRRENIGQPMVNIFKAINRFLKTENEYKIIFPIHKNPVIRGLATKHLNLTENLKIVEPLNTVEFHNLIAKASLILTDSGGIQEEAPSFGVPVLVLRDTTERSEGLDEGWSKIIGTNEDVIYTELKKLAAKEKNEINLSLNNPYGDGKTSIRIFNYLYDYFRGF